MADLVLYEPAFFGVRPALVIKGGMIAVAQMGDANASIPTPGPVMARPMFGASGAVAAKTSVAFVAPATIDAEFQGQLAAHRRFVAIGDTRTLAKSAMPLNDALPEIRVDPDSFAVWVDGELVTESPATELPMAQLYFLF